MIQFIKAFVQSFVAEVSGENERIAQLEREKAKLIEYVGDLIKRNNNLSQSVSNLKGFIHHEYLEGNIEIMYNNIIEDNEVTTVIYTDDLSDDLH